MAYRIHSIGGTLVNGVAPFQASLRRDMTLRHTSQLALSPRQNTFPAYDGMQADPFDLTFHVTPRDANLGYAGWVRAVEQLLDPYASEPTELVALWDDETTLISNSGFVISRERVHDAGPDVFGKNTIRYVVTMRFPYGLWQRWGPPSVYDASVGTSLSLANRGNAAALPSLALTSATHVAWKRFTVHGGGGSNGGLIGFPVRLALSDADATTATVFAFIGGESVPTALFGSGTINSAVWVLVDTDADGVTNTTIDVLWATGLDNPLGGTLAEYGFDLASVSMDNSTWLWDDFRITGNGVRAGAMRPALTGNHNGAANATYELDSEAVSGVTFALGTQGAKVNDADSLVLFLGAKADTTNALQGLSRTLTNFDGSNARAYVRYQVPSSPKWKTAWSSRSNGTVTTDIDIDNATVVAVGIENDGTTADPAELLVEWLAPGMTIDLLATPTITNTNTGQFDYYDGSLTLGDTTLALNQVCVPDGTLVIDAVTRAITPAGNGPLYTLDPANPPLVWDDIDNWLQLAPGNSAIVDGLGEAFVISWRDAYSS